MEVDGTRTATDLTRWRLSSDAGVHRWRYLDLGESCKSEQSDVERHLLGLPLSFGVR